jgi:uncharacterized CHY-type Zn-finger protein
VEDDFIERELEFIDNEINTTYRQCFLCHELYAEDIMEQIKLDMLDQSDIIAAIGSIGERIFSTRLEWICPYCVAKKLHDC